MTCHVSVWPGCLPYDDLFVAPPLPNRPVDDEPSFSPHERVIRRIPQSHRGHHVPEV